MAIKLLITVRSDWHLQKSCLEAFEGFFFFSPTRYQYCSLQFNCFRGSRGLPAFFPLVPSNESISSPGTSSWSSFISFDSFSASFLPAAFSPQYRSARAAAELSRSPSLPPLKVRAGAAEGRPFLPGTKRWPNGLPSGPWGGICWGQGPAVPPEPPPEPLFTGPGGFGPGRGPTWGMALPSRLSTGQASGAGGGGGLREGMPPAAMSRRDGFIGEGVAQGEVSRFPRAPGSGKGGAGEASPPHVTASHAGGLVIFKIFVC